MRKMITEKEADKLNYVITGGGETRLVNDDGAEIDLNINDVELWGEGVNFINPENDHDYFHVDPNGISMNLPSEDPHRRGWLWNDNGTLKISLG